MSDGGEATPDGRSAERSTRSDTNARWLIVNPTSGTADHVDEVRRSGVDRGFVIRETEHEKHAITLAEEAVKDGADVIAVAGGDGTVREVVQGLAEADALDDVTFGVLPTGTENIFATNIGVMDVEQGFDVLERGERRRIDVGFAGDEVFVMSCIAGLPADASVATSSELKERFGSFAFVIAGLKELETFEGLNIELTALSEGEETKWSGEALCALIGNVRRFAKKGGQANVEDGLFDLAVVERMPTGSLVAEGIAQRLFGRDTEHVRHMKASQVEIRGLDGESIEFSLDGESSTHERLVLVTHPQALTVCVGRAYEPDPEE